MRVKIAKPWLRVASLLAIGAIVATASFLDAQPAPPPPIYRGPGYATGGPRPGWMNGRGRFRRGGNIGQAVVGVADGQFLYRGESGDNRRVTGPWIAPTPVAATAAPPSGMTAGVSPQGGLSLEVDATHVELFGYFPVTVELRQPQPATADRNIVFRLFGGSWQDGGRGVEVERRATLRRGRRSARIELLVPKYQDWQLWGWDVFVDGERDPALSLDNLMWPRQGQSAGPVVLGVSEDDAGLARLAEVMRVVLNGQNVPIVQSADAQNLPKNWLDYSGVDLVVLNGQDLPNLASRFPAESAALLRWVQTGGNLWLVGAGTEWEILPEIAAALGAPPVQPDEIGAALTIDDLAAAGWRVAPTGESTLDPSNASLLLAGLQAPIPGLDRKTTSTAATPAVPPSPIPPAYNSPNGFPRPGSPLNGDSSDWFVVRGHGFGLIAAFRTGSDWGGLLGRTPVSAISQSLLTSRLSWADRHGLIPNVANPEFNNWLIPDVGVAPVTEFQILITLFVLAIGPLNYWLLVRARRLPMLLVTAPTAAAITTLLLFGYGILADGVGVQTRMRSLTFLDQTKGESAAWGRISYYAGLAPSGGMVEKKDAALYPILPDWAPELRYGRRSRGFVRQVSWDSKQRLPRGWLASRTPTQYLSVAARPTSKRLDLRETDAGLHIGNRLGVTVDQVVVQGRAGKLYWCENLADGKSQTVTPTDKTKIALALRRKFSENFAEYPAGADPATFGQTPYYGPSLSKNVMETMIEAFNSPSVEGYGDGSYLAVTDRAVGLETGVDAARESASFHVLRGKW